MLVAWVFVILLILLLSPIILLVYIARISEELLYNCLYGASKLDASDLVWTMLKSEEGQSGLIIGMIELNKELTLDECRRLLTERLVYKKDFVNGGYAFPRVRQFMKPGFINHYWVDDPNFNIENHVLLEESVSPVTCDENLQDLISCLILRPFLGASPWECLLVPKHYKGDDDLKTVLLFRLNHAIGDGSSLAYFLASSLNDIHLDPPTPSINKSNNLLDTVKGLWYMPSVYVSVLTRPVDQNILHTTGALSLVKKVSWSGSIPLDKIKFVKNSLGTTVNDVFVGVLSKSLSDYFRIQGSSSSPITIVNAVSLRRKIPSSFDNQIAALTLPFVTSEDRLETIEHIYQMKALLDRTKARREAFGLIIGLRFVSFLLPWRVLKWFLFDEINKTTGNITNLVGPSKPVKIEGRTVELLTFWQPCICNQSMSVSFCSYKDEVRLSIQADSFVMPHGKPAIILRLFEDNLNRLFKELENGD